MEKFLKFRLINKVTKDIYNYDEILAFEFGRDEVIFSNGNRIDLSLFTIDYAGIRTDKNSNDMFVGDIKNGNLYHFDLNQQRTGLLLDGPLADKVASKDEINQAIFAQGFGGIIDIEVGPDGYLYILTFDEEE